MSDFTKTVQGQAAKRERLVREFGLRVVAGPDQGRTFSSRAQGRASDKMVIGTHKSADFTLSDPTVSRFHCEISLSETKPIVRDLGSHNGTKLGGVDLLQVFLQNNDVLTLGNTQVRFELGSQDVAVPLYHGERFGRLVGRSSAMRACFAALQQAAANDSTVLLEGETGTGKDLAAESIHAESVRHKGPLIVVDCGAIAPNLLESELFGHERGAFTGAAQSRRGAFEQADAGTLFLDEIGELALDLQPKLLRALERKEVQRVGGSERIAVDVRVIAATNRNLRQEVNQKRFRADLYYRLAVLQLRIPALRERLDDLAPLVDVILSSLGASNSEAAAELRSEAFVAELVHHPWPGNVRELRNYVERCVSQRGRVPIEVSERDPLAIDTRMPLRQAREGWLGHLERGYLERLVAEHDGNLSAVAEASGIARTQLYRLLARYGLR